VRLAVSSFPSRDFSTSICLTFGQFPDVYLTVVQFSKCEGSLMMMSNSATIGPLEIDEYGEIAD